MSAKDKLNERRASSSNYGRVKTELTPDDEIRQLHEAYQFLLKKFNLGEALEEKQCLVSPFMKMSMDTDDDWKFAKEKVQDESNENEDEKTNENGRNEEETNGNEIVVAEEAQKALELKEEKRAEKAQKAFELKEEKKAQQAASDLANITMNGLLAEPEPELKRQKSLKRKSLRRKSSAVGGSKSARY